MLSCVPPAYNSLTSNSATVIAIVRLHVTYKRLIFGQISSDWTYDISFCLQNLENNAAILLACMPSTRSLLLGWISKSEVKRQPGKTTVFNQRIPGEHLLFRSLVVAEEDAHGTRPTKLPAIEEDRSDSEATMTAKPPTEASRSSGAASTSRETDKVLVQKGITEYGLSSYW